MDKQKLFDQIDLYLPRMKELSDAIFDKPEVGLTEEFASSLLEKELETLGFTVEAGIADLPTAFRAVWKNGEGGPNIGFLGEYDALRDMGHGCGHHMQTPAILGAVKALKEQIEQENIPCTLTVYGTPAEETIGGKINMANAGCFKELDAALGTHAGGTGGGVMGRNYALASYRVTFHGISAHAAGSPHVGRSAMDAMLLAFNAVEFMREHVKEEARLHYAIREAIQPSNVVPARAVASFTLRYPESTYLEQDMCKRFLNIIKGACLMTDTTCEIKEFPLFAASVPNAVLNQVAIDNMKLLNIEDVPSTPISPNISRGTTDFGNVTRVVPCSYMSMPFCVEGGSHSQCWIDNGKSEKAAHCLRTSAKALAGVAMDLLEHPETLKAAREEFNNATF